MKLERVYGSGSCSSAAIACPHPVIPGLLAYTCGTVVVMYDSQHKQQTAFFSPRPRRSPGTGKPYACLAFSRDGAYLAAGERSPHGPEILVWEVSSNRCLQALKGHKHGVSSVAFSHDGRLLVSTGESYDGQLCVWEWQAGVLLARQHTQAEVQRVCFAEEQPAGAAGQTITTVGKAGHFKVWSLTLPSSRNRDHGHLGAGGQASLTPRPANLKEYRNHHFVGVAAAMADGSAPQAQPLLYALTQTGTLLTLRPATRTIDRSLNLQVPAAFALAVSSGLIACACAAGVVRLFATRTLAFRGNLPRPSTGRSTGGAHPHAAGGRSTGGGGRSTGGGGMVSGPTADPQTSAGSLFPDAVGCAFDSSGERLMVVYADRSLMVWDVRSPTKVTRMRSVLSHSGVVWSAALIPPWQAALLGHQGAAPPPTPGGSEGGGGAAAGEAYGPSSVLCTCGADGTVRLWNVCLNNSASTAGPLGVPAGIARAAKVTRTLRAIIHASPPAGPDGTAAAAPAVPAAGNKRYAPDAPVGAGAAAGGAAGGAAKPIALRCLRVSPCSRHLATGDARGNLRVYNLASLELMLLKEAHDTEILSLDYSSPSLDGSCYLASGSRDMFVHVYDMSRGYELVGTCDAHGGAVTAVRFSSHGGRLALLSCSADKSVVFRLVQLTSCGLSFEIYHNERMARGVLYDLAVDPAGGRAVAVGQDSQLRLFDVATGRAIRNFSGDPACGEAVAVVMDTSGHLAICSCADGSVAVYDVDAGTLMARGSGHADVCTATVLLDDNRGLVSVGGDGCALLWRLTPRLAQRMQDAAAECRRQLEQQAAAQAVRLEQQRQHEQLELAQRQTATPTMRRRKAWDLGVTADAAVGGVASGGGGQQAGAAGGLAGTQADVAIEDAEGEEEGVEDDEEPQQVHVDWSATIRRVREGKPLLSMERLPAWAQRTHSPDSVAAVDPEGAGAGHGLPSDHAAPCNSGNDGNTAAIAALLPPPAPAGVWARRIAMPPASPRPLAAADVNLTVAPTAGTAAGVGDAIAAPAAVAELPVPFAGGAAATVAAVAAQPRTWAVEEDDEIVFCDSLEDGPMLGDPRDAAAEPENGLVSADEQAQLNADSVAATGNGEQAGVDDEGGLTGREMEGLPRSPEADAAEAGEEPGSGCASNRLGGPPPEAVAAEDGDAVRRDLFREHFDSLGLDQASATKAPPPDPRRLSFTQVYRQARASSAAGGQPEGATTPMRISSRGGAAGGARGDTGGGAAAAAAEPPPTTPFLSRLPLPPGTNAARGGGFGAGGPSLLDGDGAVTSGYTPDRTMLPLMSPALAKTDQQLLELDRIKQRLQSTMRKKLTSDEAALGAPRPAAGSLAAAAAAAVASPRRQAGAAAAASAQDAAARGGADLAAAAPSPALQTAKQPALAAELPETGDAQAREQAQSAGGFLLPPPPSYSLAGPNPRANPVLGDGQPSDSPPAAALPSPGFSSLTSGTPMLGRAGAEAAALAAAEGRGTGTAAAAAGEEASNRVFVFNPIYGASPATPIMGAAAAEALHRAGLSGLSPRGSDGLRRVALSAAGDAGPASSPAGSDSGANLAGPPTTEEVIRAVLESEGGTATAADGTADIAATDAAGGVCVVVSGSTGGGKESRRAAPQADALVAVTQSPGSSPAKGVGTPRRSRIAMPLPPMKPKTGASPAKSSASAGAVGSVSTGPSSAGVQACPQEPEHGAAEPAQPQGPQAQQGSVATVADAEAVLAQMRQALRDFAGAYHQLVAMPSATGAAGAISRFQTAARGAVTELSRLLDTPGTAMPSAPPGPQEVMRQARAPPSAANGPEPPLPLPLPPAVVCHSPQLSQELLSRPQAGSRLGRAWNGAPVEGVGLAAPGASASTAMAASMGGAPSASSSQVVMELGQVESMVEEKLQARMKEEMRKVEEAIMQRIMMSMAAGAGQLQQQ